MIDFSQIKVNDLTTGSVFLNENAWLVLISKIEIILLSRGEEKKHVQLRFLEKDLFLYKENLLIKEYCLPIDKSVEYFIGKSNLFDLIMA